MRVVPHASNGPLVAIVALAIVLGACASPAPSSAPGPTPTTALAPKPTSAAPGAQAQPQGQLIVVVEGEPENGLLPKMGCSLITDFTLDNVYEHLTWRNSEGQVVGELAESFERVDPTTWRFKLRRGISFHNGEPFTADAVVAAVDHEFNPNAAPGRCRGEYATIAWPAKKLDDYTVELTTTGPDPILPLKLMRFKIAAPEWLKTTPEQIASVTAVGTGPYTLVEWKRGSHILLRANERYWGPRKPKIAEVRIIGRKEASVRAAMVQTGEAHLAFAIPPDQAKQMPKAVIEKTTEVIGIRINTEHPVLKDIRVRQAIAFAIDTKGLMEALYPGYSSPVNGHMVRPGTFGYNPNLKPYPYDPARAKQLVQEAGAAGTTLELAIREANFAKITELGEAIANGISTATGLKVLPRIMEASQWRELLYAVKPGEKRSDLLMTAASNPSLDSFRVLDAYYGCNGRFSHNCDPDFTRKLATAGQLAGEERARAFQELWQLAYDNYWIVPLFGLDFIHGVSNKVSWTPRDDGHWYFVEMELRD